MLRHSGVLFRQLFPRGKLRAFPLPVFPVLPVQGTSTALTGAARSRLPVLMALQLQAAVAQWQFRRYDPLPGLPEVCGWQAAGGTGGRWHLAGLVPKLVLGWRASNMLMPGKPRSKIASLVRRPTAALWAGCSLRFSTLWGRAAPGGCGSPRSEILQVCSHLTRCLPKH